MFLCWGLHIRENRRHLSLWVGLCCIIMLFSFIHFFSCKGHFFFYSWINLYYVCGMHLPHACLGKGRLVPGPGCCDKAAMIMHVDSLLAGCSSAAQLALMGALFLVFGEPPQWLCGLWLYQQSTRISLSPYLCQHALLVFLMIIILTGVRWPLKAILIFIFLMFNTFSDMYWSLVILGEACSIVSPCIDGIVWFLRGLFIF